MEKKAEDENLCNSCKFGSMRKDDQSNLLFYCKMYQERVSHVIVECSDYSGKNQMSLHAMKECAILIDLDKPGQIGFIRPGTDSHKVFVRSAEIDHLDLD